MKNFILTIASANELSAVEFLTANLTKGQTATITIADEESANFMNKGGRNGIPTNPYFGRVKKVTTYHAWQVGTNYNRSCQNAAERSGSDKEFKSGNSWHTFYNEFFETDKSSGTKFYLQVQKSEEMTSWTETSYFVDGKKVEKETLQTWLKKQSCEMSATQKAAGVSEEHARSYNTLTLGKITEIRQGEFSYKLAKQETTHEAAANAAAK